MSSKIERATATQNVSDESEIEVVPTAMLRHAETVTKQERIVRFRGRPMIMEYEPYPHFVPIHKDRFDKIAYELLGAIQRSKVADVFAYISATAEDLTDNDHYILFGLTTLDEEGESANHPDSIISVWDMDELTMTPVSPDQAIWRSPYAKIPRGQGKHDKGPIPFIMQLAGNDPGLYDDIMQSLAPMVMTKKPDGVIWWVGDGANGKSTLMDALYKIFPGQLSSITVKRLTDGRDTPSLNGTLANIVKESSEGRIDDTEIYKSIGTHEDFRVHKFHSQDDVQIRGNLHHIFSGNSVPVFNDKGYSARRRTFIVPFNQRFESDPNFEEKTFTPELFGRLVHEMCIYANQIKRQGYRYKWSAATLGAKEEYDTEANNAEEYAGSLVAEGVVGFESFRPLKMDYDNWCAEQGYVPLGQNNLRKAIQSVGFEKINYRTESGGYGKQFRIKSIDASDLQPLGLGRPGLFTVPGFVAPKPAEAVTVPDFETVEPEVEPVEPKPSILGSKW
jgi:hypothetical protein